MMAFWKHVSELIKSNNVAEVAYKYIEFLPNQDCISYFHILDTVVMQHAVDRHDK